MADLSALYQAFSETLSPSLEVRAAAEQQINQLQGVDGAMTMLMTVLSSPDTPAATRQAIAIYFKNRIQRSWDATGVPEEDHAGSSVVAISANDKANVKNNILEAIVRSPSVVRTQLVVCLTVILTEEFPDNWLEFVPTVGSMLSATSDIHLVSAGIHALHAVVKVYQWRPGAKRQPLEMVIRELFPLALEAGNFLVTQDNEQAAGMLRLVLKAYHASMQTDLSDLQRSNPWLVAWGSLFLQVVRKLISTDVLPEDEGARAKHPWWRCKKWAFNCLNLWFCRYGSRALGSSSASAAKNPGATKDIFFAKHFVCGFAIDILRTYLMLADSYIQGKQWMSPIALHALAAFFDDAVKHTVTWKEMKPYVDVLVSRFIFPMLCFSDRDGEVWEDDPVEYVHKRLDPMEDYQSPIAGCMNLLLSLGKDRRKHTFTGILQFVNEVLIKYHTNPHDPALARQKDGALAMVGCLAEVVLSKNSPVRGQMDQFFTTHVFPDFRSPHSFLRARCCDLIVKYDELEWNDKNNLLIAYHSVGQCLQDPELPVRVQAAIALTALLDKEEVRDAISNDAARIMELLLDLTNTVDLDTLANTMDVFVGTFAEQLAPYAVQLGEQLKITFLRLMYDAKAHSEKNGLDALDCEEAGDKTMAAMGVMQTVTTLVISLDHSPEIVAKLEEAVLPIVRHVLDEGEIDLFDDALQILDALTFTAKAISPAIWGVYELIYNAFKNFGPDFISEMAASLDNYVSYGTDVFVSTPPMQEMLMDIIQSTLQNDNVGELDFIQACKLMDSVLLNCRGSADQFTPKFLDLIFGTCLREGQTKTKPFLLHCLLVVLGCFYSNPALAIHHLESRNWASGFFDLLCMNASGLSRVHDKKLLIAALSALLELPEEQQGQALPTRWPRLLEALSFAFKTLPEAIENRKREEEDLGESEDDDDDDEAANGSKTPNKGDDDDGEWDDEEDVETEENEYVEWLAAQASANLPEDANSDDEHDWAGKGCSSLQEELNFESPLDDLDVYCRIQEAFNSIQARGTSTFTYLTNQLLHEHQAVLHNAIEIANKNRAEATGRAAEKA